MCYGSIPPTDLQPLDSILNVIAAASFVLVRNQISTVILTVDQRGWCRLCYLNNDLSLK